MLRRHKVYAYITRAEQLLVFKQVDFPEAGIQIPGGTIESGELPEDAVLREAVEETGLERLHLVSYLGSDEYHISSTDGDEIHLRHFYHMLCAQDTADTWQHYENYPSDGSPDPILFEFYWLPLTAAAGILNLYYTAKLDQLPDAADGQASGS
jgi:8-oxo-dGTP pyrophosphatase MutT (NUDIX family)